MKEVTSSEDRKSLLAIARNAISESLGLAPGPPIPSPPGSGGVFVTLKLNGMLRGCIGRLRSNSPIGITVAQMARAAAFEDPRFPSLTKEEFNRIEMEISRLSGFFPIDANKVEVGLHGLLLSLGSRSGLLLPQVPGEQGWDREAFLSGLCSKAGLDDRSWENPNAKLEAFTAEVFGNE
ncbi:COG2078: Uncharacterized ACR [Olavius algarvensis spirochete endosymbiont]|uniref:AmmeMemoRadiSam system protein A n=1 Tax=Olavius algarvensis spirochete endosymbiont TaxID=260710 RepID=UPI00052E4120|nr:AmmeMemoRadiSam system protein A [Olavius algarvensis spirochete endosymbiont]KGM42757.1 hypothetical protein JY97_11830 [Alkalispirochaeta odontotermitis]VDA99465.1 COG2078: Uncharacterized ACR [Olavius algarvensis spirochete endosymbiont]